MKIKKKLYFQILKFLNTDGDNKIIKNKSLKSFYYTILSSFAVILFFFSIPTIIFYKDKLFLDVEEVRNNSKNNLEKVLSGKFLNEEQDETLDAAIVYEDIIKLDNAPAGIVRLSASTVQQLFKETNYNLDEVRRTKYVKPINLSLLPSQIKMIENTKKRKSLFIRIILPLVLEENNKIKLNRKKLFAILNKNNNSQSEINWLNLKFKQYGVKKKDLSTLKIRMDEIPVSLAIAQAAKETGWGTSRFAIEGNALFGQWTYSGEGLKPLALDNDKNHKVMKFTILKASIRAYQRNLNTHSSYKSFRKARAALRDNQEDLNSLILAEHLDKYAETGKEYTKILKQIIKQNSLIDFDNVKLLPTTIKLKNII